MGKSQRLNIARNSGHFAPVINCRRNLISKMADKNDRSQGKCIPWRIPCDFLNNLSSVDLFYEEKSWNETSCKKMLGLYSAERLIATKQYAAVPFVTFSWDFRDKILNAEQSYTSHNYIQHKVKQKLCMDLTLFCIIIELVVGVFEGSCVGLRIFISH